MYRFVLSTVISAVVLVMAVINCLATTPTNTSQWVMFGIYVVIGIIALLRIIFLFNMMDRKKKEDKQN